MRGNGFGHLIASLARPDHRVLVSANLEGVEQGDLTFEGEGGSEADEGREQQDRKGLHI